MKARYLYFLSHLQREKKRNTGGASIAVNAINGSIIMYEYFGTVCLYTRNSINDAR